MIKKAMLNMMESGVVKVSFEGDHFNKRELMRLIKALKLEHRLSIRMYRKNLMLKNIKEKENVDRSREARTRTTESSNTNSVTGTDIKSDEVSGNTKDGVISEVKVG